jgi:hypothetical protein
MSHVLEHCLDPRLAVSNAAGLLAERGLLVVETPNNGAEGLQQAGVLRPPLDVPRHLNFFTNRSLQSICEASGLFVTNVEYYGYVRQFLPKWIATELRIREIFAAKVGRPGSLPSRNRGINSWGLLLSTVRSRARLKYNCIRVVAARPGPRPARSDCEQ